MKRFTVLLWALCMVKGLFAQCPTVDFDLPDSVCLGEPVSLENTTLGTNSYLWQFDPTGYFESAAATEIINNTTVGNAFKLNIFQQDDQYYGITFNRDNFELIVLSFGDSLNTSPSIIGNYSLGVPLARPGVIEVYEEGDTLYGLFGDLTNNKFFRVNIGTDLDAPAPVATELTTITQLDVPSDVVIKRDSANVYAFVVNDGSSNSIVRVSFGSSITNTPTGEEITVPSNTTLAGMDIINRCDTWVGVITSFGSNRLVRANFADGLGSTITFNNISFTSAPTNPAGISLLPHGDSIVGYVQGFGGNLYRANFGETIDATESSADWEDLSNLGVLDRQWGIEIVPTPQGLFGFSVQANSNRIYRLDFTNSSPATLFASNDSLPASVSFNTPGDWPITLVVTDSLGQQNTITKTLKVIGSNSPDVEILADTLSCLGVERAFSAVNISGDITEYHWIRNDDTLGMASSLNYTVPTTGLSTLQLSVHNAAGCVSHAIVPLVTYAPPSTAYTVENTLCSNTALDFVNNTTGSPDSAVTWLWNFGNGDSSTEKSPSYTFASSSIFNTELIATVPGCRDTSKVALTILDGPSIDFEYTKNCVGDSVIFTGLVTDPTIIDYAWVFGADTVSSSQNLKFKFPANGSQTISYQVRTSAGCISSLDSTFYVADTISANFTATSFIENTPGTFTGVDLTPEGDMIESWSWDFDGQGLSTEPSPDFTFSTPGTVDITLSVTSSQGCDTTFTRSITVLESICPTVDFDLPTEVCQGEEVLLTNSTINANRYTWFFNPDSILGQVSAEELLDDAVVGNAFKVNLVEENGNWYGYSFNRDNLELTILSFGKNLNSTPSIAYHGGLGISLTRPGVIELIKEGSTWYGIGADLTDNTVFRLTFANGLGTAPTQEEFLTVSDVDVPVDVALVHENGEYVAFIVNSGANTSIVRLLFGNSMSNNPTQDQLVIGAGGSLGGIAIDNWCDQWSGVVTSFGTNSLFRLEFAGGINSPLSASAITLGNTITTPTGVSLVRLDSTLVGFVQSFTGETYRIDLGHSIDTNEPNAAESLSTSGLFGSSWGTEFVYGPSGGVGISASSNTSKLFRYKTPGAAPASILASTKVMPEGLQFSEGGNRRIVLQAWDNNGRTSFLTKTLSVRAFSVPEISIGRDTLSCAAVELSFSGVQNSGGAIASWIWTMENDSIVSGMNIPFQFSTQGEYPISLLATDINGCAAKAHDTVLVYNAPIVDFSLGSPEYCAFSPIDITNSTTGPPDSAVIWNWSFIDQSGNLKTPSFLSDSANTFPIRLIAQVPGCADTLTRQVIIQESPEPIASYTENCYQDSVLFIADLSDPSINSIAWLFEGDTVGETDSTRYLFSTSGAQSIHLQVSGTNGCVSLGTLALEIPDTVPANFTLPIFTENLPNSFSAVDLTGSDDEVLSWLWDFGEGASSTSQFPVQTFPAPENYNVTLTVNTQQNCTSSITQTINVLNALVPTISLSLPDTLCLNELIDATNGTVNATSFEWFFSSENIRDTVVYDLAINNPTVGDLFKLSLVQENGDWYGFGFNRTTLELVALSFGENMRQEPAVIYSQGVAATLNRPGVIELMKEGNTWYGLFADLINNTVFKAIFANGITQPPTSIQQITTSTLDVPVDITFGFENEKYWAFITNNGITKSITRLDFGSTIANDPEEDLITIASGANLGGLVLDYWDNQWTGIATSFSNNQLFRLDFTTGLEGIPTAQSISITGGLSRPAGISISRLDTTLMGFVQEFGGNLIRIDFGEEIDLTESKVETITTSGTFGSSWGTEFVHTIGGGVGFTASSNTDQVFRYETPTTTPTNVYGTSGIIPDGAFYQQSGNYTLVLKATSKFGVSTFETTSLHISSDVSPQVSILTNTTQCVENEQLFEGVLDTGSSIISWEWEPEGDTVLSGQNQTYRFQHTGALPIKLTATDEVGCTNIALDTVAIYPAPIANFSLVESLLCSTNPINTTNLTVGPPDSIIQWRWEVSGQVLEERSPQLPINSGGNFPITLIATIDGCADSATKIFDVLAGPTASFSQPNVCLDNEHVIDNESTGNNIIRYTWNFSDGTSASIRNPTHQYTSPGKYNTTLTIEDAQGCINEISDSVIVHALPMAIFSSEPICEGVPTNFFDESTVDNANITKWTWYTTGNPNEVLSTEANPQLSFDQTEATVDLTLKVVSNFGCVSSGQQTLAVSPVPLPSYITTNHCLEDSISFASSTEAPFGTSITSTTWSINGSVYSEEAVKIKFEEAQEVPISLSISLNNGCSAQLEGSFTLNEPESIGFSIPNICKDQTAVFEPTAIVNGTVYQWAIDGDTLSQTTLFTHHFSEQGSEEVTLIATTAAGCQNTISQQVPVLGLPVAQFTPSLTFGAPPIEVTFENSTQHGNTYEWFFGDFKGQKSTDENPTFLYKDEGEFQVRLVATNENGCQDIAQRSIELVRPVLDLKLTDIFLTDGGNGNVNAILNVENLGTVIIDSLLLEITINNVTKISQKVHQRIGAFQETNIPVEIGWSPNSAKAAQNICITIVPLTREVFKESNTQNNRQCAVLNEKLEFLPPYPSPAIDELRLPVLVQEPMFISYRMMNAFGAVMIKNGVGLQKGANTILFDVSQFETGIYILEMTYEGGKKLIPWARQ